MLVPDNDKGTKTFKHVFSPMKIGKLTTRNRIEVSPMEPFLGTQDSQVTDAFIKFTAAQARGGAGIVTIGDSPVTQEYADANHYVINLADPFIVHSLFRISEAIHRYGALASIELNLRADYMPADLSLAEVHQIIEDFATCAERCRKGGFDIVLLHCGHGHVVSRFYSPMANKRTDEYGCATFENRTRFINELLDAVRARISDEMAIEIRITADEQLEGGVNLEDSLALAKSIQHKIDLLHVSFGSFFNPATMPYSIQSTYVPRATNLHYAARFKQEVAVPVVTVGSFDMELAEEAIAAGKADIVAMGRAFIADEDHVNKALADKADEIRPCIRCVICTGDDPHGTPKPLRCSVNAVAGRNDEFDCIKKAEVPKKVLVVGGGCGGMEAARRLVERGHHPILIDRAETLGGSLVVAGANSIKSDIRRYAEWSVRMTEKTPGIDIRLNTNATPELIVAEAPDALIIAVGSSQIIPQLPGIEKENVVLAIDVDQGKVKVGRKVVVVGAGLTGTETAVSLAQEGHDVTIIDRLSAEEISAASSASNINKMMLGILVEKNNIESIYKASLIEVTDTGIRFSTDGNAVEELDCDSVVLSLGVRPESATVDYLSNLVTETYVIGDCVNRAGNITSSVREAFFAAMNI